jgi:hypothetical protein
MYGPEDGSGRIAASVGKGGELSVSYKQCCGAGAGAGGAATICWRRSKKIFGLTPALEPGI